MSTKADIKRIRLSLQQERLNLKQLELELEQRKRALLAERVRAVALLRMLCERYGDNSWDPEQPLDEILTLHLKEPLDLSMRQIAERLSERSRAPQLIAPPASQIQQSALVRPIRPVAAPRAQPRADPAHGYSLQRSDRGDGYRVVCACGWASAATIQKATAEEIGDRHIARFAAAPEPDERKERAR